MVNLGRVGIVPQGAYDEETEYKKLDLVTDGGSAYLYTSDTPGTGVALTDPVWLQIVEKGDQGIQGPQGPKGDTGTIDPADQAKLDSIASPASATDGQVLTADGAGGTAWAEPAGGGVWAWEYTRQAAHKDITAFDHTTGVYTSPGHGFSVGARVRFTKTSLYLETIHTYMPMLTTGVFYEGYVVQADTNTFVLSATEGGTPYTYQENANMDLTKFLVAPYNLFVGTFTLAGLPPMKKCRVTLVSEGDMYEGRFYAYTDQTPKALEYDSPYSGTTSTRIMTVPSTTNSSWNYSGVSAYRRIYITCVIDAPMRMGDFKYQFYNLKDVAGYDIVGGQGAFPMDWTGTDFTSVSIRLGRGYLSSPAIGTRLEVQKLG